MPTARGRRPLSRDRVLKAAIDLADAEGIAALSMRRLGQELRVEAMSLYKHVSGKEEILDGITELVMAEVDVPSAALPWRESVRRAATSLHRALLRHPWAGAVLESRVHPGPARLRYLDAMIGVLRTAGFSLPDVTRAFLAIDSIVYGHALQLASLPYGEEAAPDAAAALAQAPVAQAFPNLVAMAEMAMGGPVPTDLDFGLDLVLDGLERHLAANR